LTVEATLEDESAKIPLTHVDFPTLRDLFMLLGQKQSDAEQLADAMLVWIQQGYEPVNSFSIRATDYKRAAIPHDPPARSLHSFAELASIQLVRDRLFDENGRPNDLWRSFVDSVSLFDFSQPNTNTAKMTTLAAFGGYDEGTMKLISDYVGGLGSYSRQGPAYFQNAQEVNGLVGSASSTRMGTQVRCLRINVTVREGQTSFRVSAVVTASGGAQLPPPDQLTAADTSTSSAGANDTTAGQNNASTSDATAADAGTATSNAAGQTPSTLNYPFTLMEIRENDEIVESVSSSQSAQP
jgi:general secretion pathway protein K